MRNLSGLYLTLSRSSFQVMVTGEKKIEYRNPSKWILSRLNKSQKYKTIKFTNGYGNDKPFFICDYKGWSFHSGRVEAITYSNGLLVDLSKGTVKIVLGNIIEVGNFFKANE